MPDAIARLRGLLEKASHRPWMLVPLTELQMFDDGRHMHAIQRSGLSVHGFDEILRDRTKPEDAALIVSAVNHLDRLLRVVEAAREADELIRGFLEDGIAINLTALDEAHEAMRDALRGLDDDKETP